MNYLRKVTVLACLVLLSSCGGGGGGGESSSNYGIRLFHGAIDAQPADLSCVSGEVLAQRAAAFGDVPSYVALGQGVQSCSVTIRSSIQQPSSTLAFEVTNRDRRTALLFEANSTLGYNVALIADNFPEVATSEAAFRVVHVLRGVEDLDLAINGGVSQLARASASEYIVVPAGILPIRVEDRGDQVIDTAFSLSGGKVYSLFLTGEQGYFVLPRLVEDN